MTKIDNLISDIQDTMDKEDMEGKVKILNTLRAKIHDLSPFKEEPIDLIQWVKCEEVKANDYNPNSVAPPEMKLLEHSIDQDGYTQPVVTWSSDEGIEVVDGFHRTRVCKESKSVNHRVNGYLPVVFIKNSQSGKGDRISSTIRHNRARGKHQVDLMSEIVVELKNRNWTNSRISKELGMDEDEILRLCQITGLHELFSDVEFSKSWDVEGELNESDFEELTDDVDSYGSVVDDFRAVNTNDEDRVFHTYEKWECYKAGFYNTTMNGKKKSECEKEFKEFICDSQKFESSLKNVISEWKNSCEHYLSNSAMNRIAWLGQAGVCYATGIPSTFRGGFDLLSEAEKDKANKIALKYLNKWLSENNREKLTMEEALTGRQSDIY